jgi:cold shock CspA family protein
MRILGTVASYNGQFGFIFRDDKLPDVFVAAGAVSKSGLNTLVRFQRVEVDCIANPRKPGRMMAANIKIVESVR